MHGGLRDQDPGLSKFLEKIDKRFIFSGLLVHLDSPLEELLGTLEIYVNYKIRRKKICFFSQKKKKKTTLEIDSSATSASDI